MSRPAVRSPEVSHRRQIVADTGDDVIYTSAHKVGSIDDLMIKILTGLPLKSLGLFKSVCKRWSSLITDPNFTLLRNRNPNADHPLALFLQLQADSSSFAFVPLYDSIPIKRRPLITTFPIHSKRKHIEVLHSCNGLVLCHEWPDKLYVYNPTLNHCKLLPLPHIWYPKRLVSGMVIAFDPAKSSHYKIVYSFEDLTSVDIPVRLEIYSSETGCWSVCDQSFSVISFLMFDRRVIYWRDALHWMDNLDVYHFDFDLENPRFILVENHRMLNGMGDCYDDKLLMSRDSLLLVKMAQPQSLSKMNVYEMKNGYSSGWSIRYHVDLDCAGNFKLVSGRGCRPISFNVLAIVLGKREEDSFLVLEVNGIKLVQYNIFSKTFHELCDLAPIRICGSNAGTFLFTLSLAGV